MNARAHNRFLVGFGACVLVATAAAAVAGATREERFSDVELRALAARLDAPLARYADRCRPEGSPRCNWMLSVLYEEDRVELVLGSIDDRLRLDITHGLPRRSYRVIVDEGFDWQGTGPR